jgi:hypothetical protein
MVAAWSSEPNGAPPLASAMLQQRQTHECESSASDDKQVSEVAAEAET